MSHRSDWRTATSAPPPTPPTVWFDMAGSRDLEPPYLPHVEFFTVDAPGYTIHADDQLRRARLQPRDNGRESAVARLAATGTDDATADPDPAAGAASSRGARRGSTAASGGTARHAVAGWDDSAGSRSATISMPSTQPNPGKSRVFAPFGSLRREKKKEAPVGVEPTMADLQSAALATWLRRRMRMTETLRQAGQHGQVVSVEVTLPGRFCRSRRP